MAKPLSSLYSKAVGCPVALGYLALPTGVCVFIAELCGAIPTSDRDQFGSGYSSQRGGASRGKPGASETWDEPGYYLRACCA